MITTIFYTLSLFFITALVLITKKSSNNKVGVFLLSVYCFIGLMAIIVIGRSLIYIPELSLFPYILLLFSYYLVLSPFLKKNNFQIDNLVIKNYNFYKYISVIYIAFSIITVISLYSDVMNLLLNGNWRDNIILGYTQQQKIAYSNVLEWLALNFVNYFRLIATIIYFVMFKNGKNPKLRVILLISLFLSIGSISIYNSSRGMIFNYMLLFIAIFLFFNKGINLKNKRKLKRLVIFIGGLALWYAIIVTIDRFSGFNDTNTAFLDSIIMYFGHAPIVFNYGITTINQLSYGTYSFGKLFELFGKNIMFSQSIVGGSWGSLFYTYVGPIYLDFGILGVIIISLGYNLILKYLLNKNYYSISSIYIVFVIYSYLLEGAFVIGRSYVIELIGKILIYIILFLFEKIKIRRSYNLIYS